MIISPTKYRINVTFVTSRYRHLAVLSIELINTRVRHFRIYRTCCKCDYLKFAFSIFLHNKVIIPFFLMFAIKTCKKMCKHFIYIYIYIYIYINSTQSNIICIIYIYIFYIYLHLVFYFCHIFIVSYNHSYSLYMILCNQTGQIPNFIGSCIC